LKSYSGPSAIANPNLIYDFLPVTYPQIITIAEGTKIDFDSAAQPTSAEREAVLQLFNQMLHLC